MATIKSLRSQPVGLVALDEGVEKAEIPTVATWDSHDCKLTVTKQEGFLCKVQLSAKIDYPPDKVFDILVDPDNSRYFSTLTAVTYRQILENNRRGRQKVEVEQAGELRFLFFVTTFYTRLYVVEDKPKGVVEFKLAKKGFMKNFEGKWEVRPFDQHSLDQISGVDNPLGDLVYKVTSLLPSNKPQSTLITLEQSVLPSQTPPAWFEGYVARATGSVIQSIVKDLKNEVERVKSGKPIPKHQLKKLEKATRLINSRRKQDKAVASLASRRSFGGPQFLF